MQAHSTQSAWRPVLPPFPQGRAMFQCLSVNARLICSLPTWSCLLAAGTSRQATELAELKEDDAEPE